MSEIKCPHCGKVFQVDESGYNRIAEQVRNQEFAKSLAESEKLLAERKNQELKLKEMQLQGEHERSEQTLQRQIAELKSQLANAESAKLLAVKDAEQKFSARLSGNDKTIAELKSQLANAENEKQLALSRREQALNKQIFDHQIKIKDLNSRLENQASEQKIHEQQIIDKFAAELDVKNKEIDYYKDLKAKLSTKMLGETLEQHCFNSFESIHTIAFPHALFGKDNDASGGSKGDFIFRDFLEDDTEFISIMFEMKNESDTTATKHKNEDFFKELDKDRNEKKCEYAILVSLLERDSELYNQGIVDVSHKYPKMFVIRPQFFLPVIGLLRNAALNSAEYRRELIAIRHQQLDVTAFSNNLREFQESFGKRFALAGNRFSDAIAEIDKSIATLQKARENLMLSEKYLRLDNDEAQKLSIEKLTKDAPSVRAMFKEAGEIK